MASSASELHIIVDVVVPVLFIAALCVVNCFVLRIIMRKRKEYQYLTERTANTIEAAAANAAPAAADGPTTSSACTDRSCPIEMERL
ncbi:PREDICTED: uncharacterized protein LOC108615161 [Drosophila arizonae]|uniref:Uncharacterized protein n=2 Tax=mojavensis species complex TaxID=198037 RepID=A0A0Q9XLS3_DROMO|nr:PREDICTED: uncharacterized protein LOC108615161 [Drosophila arizonae]KRG05409.1 uncharacterized protein Dmoj_GI26063 [Drosophila mojavensis]